MQHCPSTVRKHLLTVRMDERYDTAIQYDIPLACMIFILSRDQIWLRCVFLTRELCFILVKTKAWRTMREN